MGHHWFTVLTVFTSKNWLTICNYSLHGLAFSVKMPKFREILDLEIEHAQRIELFALTAIVNGPNNAAASYFQSWYILSHSWHFLQQNDWHDLRTLFYLLHDGR